jgi:dihydrofolate reductase
MRISIIAALASNGSIGLDNRLPWHLPEDLAHFKRTTLGHHLLMGRKTWDSVGRPLPGRKIVVITRQKLVLPEGVRLASSIEGALNQVTQEDEIFVAGGAEIYRQTLDLADRMYLTRIHQDFPGDTFFPEFDESDWELVSRVDRDEDERNPYSFSFLTYDKIAQ